MNEEVEQPPFYIHGLIFLVLVWIGPYRIVLFGMFSPNHLLSNSRAAEETGSMSQWAVGVLQQTCRTNYV